MVAQSKYSLHMHHAWQTTHFFRQTYRVCLALLLLLLHYYYYYQRWAASDASQSTKSAAMHDACDDYSLPRHRSRPGTTATLTTHPHGAS